MFPKLTHYPDDGLLLVAQDRDGGGWWYSLDLGYLGGGSPESPPEWLTLYAYEGDASSKEDAMFKAERHYSRWLVGEGVAIEEENALYDASAEEEDRREAEERGSAGIRGH